MSTAQQTPPATPPGSGTATPSVPSTPASTSGTATPNVNGIAEGKAIPDGKEQSDTSKLKTFLSILRKFIGVSDIAAVRFSLPAQLLEPTPNLEYWGYLDRPETFIAIGDSDDELGRMLACLKFWFTKDLKYVKGKPCKPYNSTLGEFFRCQWEVTDDVEPIVGEEGKTNQEAPTSAPNGEATTKGQPIKVSYLTEQTSHHPPVSAFYIDCPDKGISARGYDQLSAKFTGTSVKVIPGSYNKGIFITVHKRDNEEYHMTHPAAFLGGFLRGNLNVTVSDTCFIACAKTGIKVLLHYLEEGYFGKTQNKVEGVVYKCDVESDKTTKISDVPDKDVLGRLEGNWREKVYFAHGATPWKKVSESDKILIIDLNPLQPQKKICPPDEEQLPNESRRFWKDVTNAILNKQYSTATTRKQELEEAQRQVAARRKEAMKKWM
jgi:oxysterol-binding protein-related protein 9/10/11